MVSDRWPLLGCGVGLRTQHYNHILSERPKMDWFEATSENFMDSGGRPIQVLEKVRRNYPVALHGVSLSIGSADPLDLKYLERLKALVLRIDPAIVSDHLCWSGVEEEILHDLLPLPFTEEAITYLVPRIQKVQEFIGRTILMENVSTYVTYKHSVMPEWEFITEVARRSGCGILLDLNNVYVNSKNHNFDPFEYVRNIPGDFVGQFHLAGHTDMGTFLFDTHSSTVINPVWELYREALRLYGRVTTLIEWDEAVPEFSGLAEECEKARVIYLQHPEKQSSKKEPENISRVPLRDTANAPSLLAVQRIMKARIHPGRQIAAEEIKKVLNIAGEERLDAYSNGYVARVHESLSEVYQAVKHLAGDQAFEALAHHYAAAYSSHNYNLNYAGEHLPEFLKTVALSENLPFLPDLARLEWQVAQAFHAFQGEPFDASVLSAFAPEGFEKLHIHFQPSVSIVASEWPVLDLWKARKTLLKEINIDLVDRPQNVLVFRNGLEVFCEAVDLAQSRLLGGLLSGRTLGEACEWFAENLSDHEPADVSAWFARWAANSLVARCVISDTVSA